MIPAWPTAGHVAIHLFEIVGWASPLPPLSDIEPA